MRTRSSYRILALALLFAVTAGCTLPGAASPTQFTFPTPNLTHTAIFAAMQTPSATSPSGGVPPERLSGDRRISLGRPHDRRDDQRMDDYGLLHRPGRLRGYGVDRGE